MTLYPTSMTRIAGVLDFLQTHHPEAFNEVQFHYDLEGEPDEPKEWHHAFVDAFVQAEDLQDAPLVKAFRKALIHVAWYYPMTEQDLRNRTVSSGTKWEFKMNKTPYSPQDGDLRVWLTKNS